jgi:hypothetical protein
MQRHVRSWERVAQHNEKSTCENFIEDRINASGAPPARYPVPPIPASRPRYWGPPPPREGTYARPHARSSVRRAPQRASLRVRLYCRSPLFICFLLKWQHVMLIPMFYFMF